MAILNGPVAFTGPMNELSAYKMQGVDKIILRRKGGVSKQVIKTNPAYELTRRNNEEWKACIKATRNIRMAMQGVAHLGNYNFWGNINALCKYIQQDDDQNELGRRSVLISRTGYKLEGFCLNREHGFESMLRSPLQYTVDRNGGSAQVTVPDIYPGINFNNPKKQPLYRFVFVLGAVPDMVYNEAYKMYMPTHNDIPAPVSAATPWCSWKQSSPGQQLQLVINNWQAVAGNSLLLWAGIEFGVPVTHLLTQYVKYSGCARLLQVV
jgi:hypothetical protein